MSSCRRTANRMIIVPLFAAFIAGTLPLFEDFVGSVIIPLTDRYFVNSTLFGISFSAATAAAFAAAACRIFSGDGRPLSFPTALLLCSVSGLWIYYGFFNRIWRWIEIPHTGISYAGLAGGTLTAMLLCHAVRFCIDAAGRRKKTSGAVSGSLKMDHPILSGEEDLLGRRPFAKNLAEHIKALDTDRAGCSVAVISPWGGGKTSFINLLMEELRNDPGIRTMHFTPWHLAPDASLTDRFFHQLASESGDFDAGLKKWIGRYADFLQNASPVSSWLKIFAAEERPDELFEKISARMRGMRRKLLIIIDDIDRLDADEIGEVFRIVRGSANFPNVVFLCPFDKHYVQKALKDSCPSITDSFIEKFFQVEFSLPGYDRRLLGDIVKKEAGKFLSETDYAEFTEYLDRYSFMEGYPAAYDPFANLRGIYRWLNNVRTGYSILEGECRISDLADIEMLKLLFREIYDILQDEPERYMCKTNGYHVLWNEGMAHSGNSSRFDWSARERRDLFGHPAYGRLSDREKEHLKHILERLLPVHKEPARKAFADPFYTQRYFYGILQHTEMPDTEFKALMSRSFGEIKEIIRQKETGMKIHSLCRHLHKDVLASDEETEKCVRMIFYIPTVYDGCGCDPHTIVSRLDSMSADEKRKKDFLIGTLHENGASEFVAAHFSTKWYAYSGWEKYITKDEAAGIVADMLKYAVSEERDDKEIWEFYGFNAEIRKEYGEDGQLKESVAYYPVADGIMKRYIAGNFVRLASSMVWEGYPGGEPDGMYYPSRHFIRLWGTWQEFTDYCMENNVELLKDEESKRVCGEYETFLREFESRGGTPFHFEFSAIVR